MSKRILSQYILFLFQLQLHTVSVFNCFNGIALCVVLLLAMTYNVLVHVCVM